MALRADDLQAACRKRFLVQLDIGTTSGHVRRDGDRVMDTGILDDLRFKLMELRVQHIMLDPFPAQHAGKQLRYLNGNRAHQDGLVLLMRFLHSLNDRAELLLLRHIDGIIQVLPGDRLIRRDLNDIHAIDIAELLLFRQGGTGHAGFLLIFVEEVLEGNGREGLGLSLDLDMLLRFDRLVQAVGIASSGHDTPRELIDDQDLIILYDIILIPVHQVVGAQRQDDIVLDLDILRIRQVVDLEETLALRDALLGQRDDLILLIDNEISGLGDLLAHEGCHLRHLAACLAPLQLPGEDVAGFVKLGRLSALSGNDQRCPGFVDQDGVHLVDDRVDKVPLYKVFLVNDHVVTQVIESVFVVCDVCDVLRIFRPALIGLHRILNAAAGQAQKLMDRPHPVPVTLCQIIIDRDDMNPLAGERIQIRGKRRYERLTFTGTHLCDPALVKDDTADHLHTVRLQPDDPPGCLAHCGKCLREKVVQTLSFLVSLLEFSGLSLQLFICQL